MTNGQAWRAFLRELTMERCRPVPAPPGYGPIGETTARLHRVELARALGLDPADADYERVVEPEPPRPSRKANAAVRRYRAAVG